MLERGCKNFIYLPRSSTAKPEAAQLVAWLKGVGASVDVYSVDVTNSEAIAKAIAEVSRTRPIRGVIHAAMVLQGGLYENMTSRQYNAPPNPKMHGVLALNNALKNTPLEFFIMTSTLSAVLGNPSQANYCAGNSFLSYFALNRRKRGQVDK
ncbi:polyketide synthase [Polychaeton citri CBS 116435]|uniref:Polyketide synthase n=1 Tax=Polychaeton citri CBS 116435 TaxID=1314669 RepID=A0A9P4ULP8_9PEZI|nr:polyketide synthase [Polychaeton citri CBS 116435]